MTRKEVEMALLQMGREMKAMVEAYAPNVNHMSITAVDGTIMVTACEWDTERQTYIVKDILDAIQFKDGDIKTGGEYIDAEGGAA